uniref:Uncharacterized protein n=1 Tax=Rhizophora mucronata TaxID=61149 RepID=A0A2P2Q0E0_RHIMU
MSVKASSTKVVLVLFASSMSFFSCLSSFLPELSDDVKELSMEHNVLLIFFFFISSKIEPPVSVNPEIAELGHTVLTIETN